MSFRDLGREFLEHLEAFLSVLLIVFFDVLTTAVVVYVLLEAAEFEKGLILKKDPQQYADLLRCLPYFDEGVLGLALLFLAGRLMRGLVVRLYRRQSRR